MGAFLGEACKVPFILRRFQPHWSDRCHSAVVVIATNDTVMTPNECRREFCGNAMLLQICGACVIFFSNTIAFRRHARTTVRARIIGFRETYLWRGF